MSEVDDVQSTRHGYTTTMDSTSTINQRLETLAKAVAAYEPLLVQRTQDLERHAAILQAVRRAARAADDTPAEVLPTVHAPPQPDPKATIQRARHARSMEFESNRRFAAMTTVEQIEYLRAAHDESVERAAQRVRELTRAEDGTK